MVGYFLLTLSREMCGGILSIRSSAFSLPAGISVKMRRGEERREGETRGDERREGGEGRRQNNMGGTGRT
eukprot:764335-Hanusia_phi.AAC.1